MVFPWFSEGFTTNGPLGSLVGMAEALKPTSSVRLIVRSKAGHSWKVMKSQAEKQPRGANNSIFPWDSFFFFGVDFNGFYGI